MNTGTGITGGEVAVEAGIDMIVIGTAAEKEIIVAEAGAAVPVPIVTNTMGEANTMKSAAVGANLTKVPLPLGIVSILKGAHLHVRLIRVKFLMDATLMNVLLLSSVFHQMVGDPFLEVDLHVDHLPMNDAAVVADFSDLMGCTCFYLEEEIFENLLVINEILSAKSDYCGQFEVCTFLYQIWCLL